MQITGQQNKLRFMYTMGDTPLVTTEQHVYIHLGIHLHHKPSWQLHIELEMI